MNHFFLDHSAPTHIDTLSLHDALPISSQSERERWLALPFTGCDGMPDTGQAWVRSGLLAATVVRSEEHTSELQSRQYIVCRHLLEKKKTLIAPISRLDCTRLSFSHNTA